MMRTARSLRLSFSTHSQLVPLPNSRRFSSRSQRLPRPPSPVVGSGKPCMARWQVSMRSEFSATGRIIDSSVCWNATPTIWADPASLFLEAFRSRSDRRRLLETTGTSGSTGPSSFRGGPSGSRASLSNRHSFRLCHYLDVERRRNTHKRGDGRIWSLRREESTHGFRLHVGPARDFCLGEIQLDPALVERADKRVNGVDRLSSIRQRIGVLRIFFAILKVPFRTSSWFDGVPPGRNTYVTSFQQRRKPNLGAMDCAFCQVTVTTRALADVASFDATVWSSGAGVAYAA